jgi:hypothetical protein
MGAFHATFLVIVSSAQVLDAAALKTAKNLGLNKFGGHWAVTDKR